MRDGSWTVFAGCMKNCKTLLLLLVLLLCLQGTAQAELHVRAEYVPTPVPASETETGSTSSVTDTPVPTEEPSPAPSAETPESTPQEAASSAEALPEEETGNLPETEPVPAAPLPALAEGEILEAFPEAISFTQVTKKEVTRRGAWIRTTLPHLANAGVEEVISGRVAALRDRLVPEIPTRYEKARPVLETGAVISRAGRRILSFLVLSELMAERQLQAVEYETYTYNLESGQRLMLSDIFEDSPELYALLGEAVRTQLSEAYPAMEAPEETLQRLTSREALQQAEFTIGPSRLRLTYRADTLYPGTKNLLHVHVYLSELRPYMKEVMREELDMSMFRMAALTFDDGPANISTRGVLDALRRYGQSATFFIIGRRIHSNLDMLNREHDAGYSVQNHTYTHQYDIYFVDSLAEKEKTDAELCREIGVGTTMIRAPGGYEKLYMDNGIGVPILHWSLSAKDSGNDQTARIAEKTRNSIHEWEVVLMHDVNPNCPDYAENIIRTKTEQGFLFVTAEELFHEAGEPLLPNHTYYQPFSERTFED